MKKYKLKSWVVSLIYVVSIAVIVASLMMVGKYFSRDIEADEPVKFVSNENIINQEEPVISVVQPTNATVNHPYLLESVEIAKNFYDKKASEEEQIKSLIYYKNTYMENTGVIYTNNGKFDVVSVLDGTVTSITKDDILGNVVEIMHTNELITIYSCLDEVLVKVGDKVKQNDVIGNSGQVNIDKGYDNALLFEVNYKGSILNPIEFYNMKVADLMEQ